MLKVVIDTNVLVSALVKPGSGPEIIISLALSGEIILCLSDPIFVEYEEVLKRGKFSKLNQSKVKELLLRIRSQAQWVEPKTRLEVTLVDPEDNKFLECAMEAGADLLITGNVKHFPKKHKDMRIVSPAQFLSYIVKTLDF